MASHRLGKQKLAVASFKAVDEQQTFASFGQVAEGVNIAYGPMQ